MKHDEILQAAKEATNKQPIYGRKEFTFSAEELQRFASIIEKRTIERCEAACNSLMKQQKRHGAAYGFGYLVYDAEDCAAAIRKLGEQE